jgi:hypothetical protein
LSIGADRHNQRPAVATWSLRVVRRDGTKKKDFVAM